MHRSLRTRLACALAALCALGSPVLVAPPADAGLVSTYVVTLRQDGGVAETARDLAASLGGSVVATYSHVMSGFAVRLPAVAAEALGRDPRVLRVSPDAVVHAAGEQRNPPWGLDRVDQRRRPLDRRFVDPATAGKGAHVYVVDTGINPDHSEFAGRVGESRNFIPALLFGVDPDDWGDCNGHGTHVASTAVGTQWGVAKKATVHAVRVLNCSGSGVTSDILEALDWIAANHRSPAVANLSFGETGRSPELDAAARGLVRAGVSVVAAAGNEAGNACNFSPAGEPLLLTVAASNQTDQRAPFSNAGTCADLFAPGTGITGADYLSSTGSVQLSGTSMAAPHVAGAVALLRARRPNLTAVEAQTRIVRTATPGVVGAAGAYTPNRLLRVLGGDLPPRARFTTTCTGLRCTFSARRSGDDRGISRFRWVFGNGDRARGETIGYRFARAGWKWVTLRVVDSSGQVAVLTTRVSVRRA
ncbi:MAG TPA: S8 family serine peptidase [Nocardioidaceae bacterium]|nr:S8 family serine peptidase [Nocardioidaceae bacterium]